MKIEFDKYSLIIDGKRECIRSGALHYFRSPGEVIWRDRLSKLKAAGYNTVDIYFNWGYHCEEKGEYDFTGIKDVNKLLEIAKELELFVIARPGPYINAEISAGGFPKWLLNEPDVILRNRVGGDYQYSPKYMEFLKDWYKQIIPIINNFDNIIAFQIENEYSTNMAEEDYMKELYDIVREMGVTAPIFHNDAYSAGLYADIVDIYACDIYPYINPDQNWREDHFCFDTLDNLEENIKPCKEDAPVYIAEMQGGWFDKWCGPGYKHIREQFGRDHINIVTSTAISQGVTMFNHYMGCGGTSWDELGCDEVYTSYEFTAPVSEEGLLQENYFKAKEINYLLKSFNLSSTDMKAQEDEILKESQENIYAKLRADKLNKSDWLFIRNLNKDPKDIELVSGFTFSLKPYDMKILPVDLQLKTVKLEFSTAQLLGKIESEDYEVVMAIADNDSYIKISEDVNVVKNTLEYENNILKLPQGIDFSSIVFEKDGKTTELVMLVQDLADKTWILEDKIIIGAQMLTNNNKDIGISKDATIKIFDLDSKVWSGRELEYTISVEQPQVTKTKTIPCAPEINLAYDYSDWHKVKGETDCISNNVFDEFIWYKSSYKGKIEELEFTARHCWAVYINGHEICSRDSYCYTNLYEDDETLKFNVPIEKQKDVNQITVLVQNIGFDKGFSNDTNIPRGILKFKTFPEKEIEWSIRGKTTPELEKWDNIPISEISSTSENSYLSWQYFEFDFDKSKDVFKPLMVHIKNEFIEKAAIFLNGRKIGRYWKGMSKQSEFYLIDSFLKDINKLSLVIWVKKSNLQQIKDFKFAPGNVIISIKNKASYQLFKVEDVLSRVDSNFDANI